MPPIYTNLQLRQQSLTLQQQHNLMHRRPHIRLGHINNQIRLLGLLIRIIHARETLDFARTRLGIHTPTIRLLRMFQRRSDMDEEERAVSLDRLAGRATRGLERRNGCSNGRGTGFGEFGGDKGNASNVFVAVFAGETEF
jgi:hypothetical protein